MMNGYVLVLVGASVAVLIQFSSFSLFSLYGSDEHNSDYRRDYPPISFNCPPLPPLERPARNVYELRPQDIKVVMALGDSITAGT